MQRISHVANCPRHINWDPRHQPGVVEMHRQRGIVVQAAQVAGCIEVLVKGNGDLVDRVHRSLRRAHADASLGHVEDWHVVNEHDHDVSGITGLYRVLLVLVVIFLAHALQGTLSHLDA